MPESPDHADVRVFPPAVFVAALAVGGLLHWILPLRFAAEAGWRVPLGLAVVAAGFAVGAWTFAALVRTNQNPHPATPTPELIQSGPFRLSRNPIYVGMAAVQAGIGIAVGSVWILLLLIPAIAVVQRTVIEREEAYLERKFGESYRAYRGSVRRWL
jgi:protein-S-isoprenylcysteine O-methyltransferase Ste14